MLAAFPGLFATPWEVRPARGAFTLLPAPLSAAEVPRGTVGVRARRPRGNLRQGAWQLEPLVAPAPGEPDTGEPQPPRAGPGGRHGLFYVDATLDELVQQLPATGRSAVVRPAVVVAAPAGELAVLARTVVLSGRMAQALTRAGAAALEADLPGGGQGPNSPSRCTTPSCPPTTPPGRWPGRSPTDAEKHASNR